MLDADAFFSSVVRRLRMDVTGACWHLTDPGTGLITWTGHGGELPGDLASAFENELLEDDVAKYAELTQRRAPVASLVAETGGEPRRSARYRRHLEPEGFADELRCTFTDAYGCWGSLGVFAERPFSAADRAAVATLVPEVARALRQGVASAGGSEGGPGVLVLDARDRVRLRDLRVRELLGEAVPGAIVLLAARARSSGGPVSGRLLAGVWLTVDASPLVDDPGAVAVVVAPAAPPSVLELRLRAAELTAREREIALAVLRGDDTAAIAGALHLSPYTVQDHLKAIFDKTGVRSRRAFVARWALAVSGAR